MPWSSPFAGGWVRVRRRSVERVFYSGMAILLCVYIGFSPTYFQAGMMRTPLPSPILHIHGAAFTL